MTILTIHFNSQKKNVGMKETGFGKHLEARMSNNQQRTVKPNYIKPTKFRPIMQLTLQIQILAEAVEKW